MAADSNRQAGRFPKGVISACSASKKESHPSLECFRLTARPEKAPDCLWRLHAMAHFAEALEESLSIAVLLTLCRQHDETALTHVQFYEKGERNSCFVRGRPP